MTITRVSGHPAQYLPPASTSTATKANVRCRIYLAMLALVPAIGATGPAFAEDADLPEQMPVQIPEQAPAEQPPDMLVLVAGATGGAGGEIVRVLLANGYRVRGFVRDEDKARARFGDQIEYAVGDVREPATISAALDGIDALISAVGGSGDDPDNGPEFVDYGGVRHMAEAAAAAGLRRFVLVSSIGVTHEDQVLNKMFNNVLEWKFKGEQALRASGVPYTIVRPGGLVDEPGGLKPVVFAQGDDSIGTIPLVDLARVCVAALGSDAAVNKTFEITSGRSAKDGADDGALDAAFAALTTDSGPVPTASEQ